VLAEAVAFFDCRVVADVEAGDHRRVVNGAVLNPAARPLTYTETGDLDGSAELFPDDFSGGQTAEGTPA
jgi:flavin reductase (DIM6/NTAB) family NADH-FMN oxidoreductase RutF